MRRISLALALIGAVVATGCGGGGKAPNNTGAAPGVAEGTFTVTIQNGQNGNAALAIKGGLVTSDPAGISCGVGGSVCSFDFPIGQTVTLSAVASGTDTDVNKPFQFLGWAGDCQGATCVLSGNADKYVLAMFGGEATGHPNWSDSALHGPAYRAQTLVCTNCHGANLQGQGIAVSCGSCHGAPAGTPGLTEQCSVCHSTGAPRDMNAAHAINTNVKVSTTPVVANGGDLQFDVTIKVGGVNSNAFTTNSGGYRYAYVAAREATAPVGSVLNAFERFTLTAGTQIAVAAPTSGTYRVTIPGAATLTGNQTFMVRLTDNAADPMARLYATAVSHFNAPARDLVGDQACMNCHGDNVFRHREANGEFHHGANPQGVSACVVCHTRYGSTSRAMGGDRLTAYVHGVHASHQMPARTITAASIDPDGSQGPLPAVVGPFTATKLAGVYARNDSLSFVDPAATPLVAQIASPFSVGYPTYLSNCAACHDSPTRLADVMSKPMSASTCFSCHDSFEGFTNTKTGGALAATHATVVLSPAGTAAANPCATCHSGKTVGDYHGKRQAYTERNGLLYDGKDQSIEQGKRVALKIDSVSYDTNVPPRLVVQWSATLDGNPVDPCNTDIATGPVFMGITAADTATGASTSNMSILQAYAQGNDWTNNGVGTSPGQPVATASLSMTAASTGTVGPTTCASNVATTIVTPATSGSATRGAIALQGKPQMTFTSGSYTRIIQLRSKSPVREFVVGTGAEPAQKRRQIVDTNKCLACHPGSLYQHGGNRVDSVDLCVTCHNPASSEQNVRVGLGITAANSYDGKVGQTYELRTMLHAIHSAGETDKGLVYYRSNGIYLFGSEATIAAAKTNKSWPGTGTQVIYGSTGNVTRTHNEIVVHYPRALNDCQACHINNTEKGFVSQATGVATTVDAGAAPWANGNDDTLMGANASSCMSCHGSGDATLNDQLLNHAFGYGWQPKQFQAGRDTVMQNAQ